MTGQPSKSLTEMIVANGETLTWGRRTYVMGVINLSLDSFSGDGLGTDIPAIVERALRLEEEGADILDVGAESTRPGSKPIDPQDEIRLVTPALEAVAAVARVPVSVDTYKAGVAKEAVAAGATIINDVWGLKADPHLAQVAAETGTPLVLMHNQKTRKYKRLLPDMFASLAHSIKVANDAGVAPANVVLDPGIGFGKTPDHNLEIVKRLTEFRALGYPLLVGTSRKSTIGYVLDLPVDQRLEGTAATVALSIAAGADAVRVHDVKEMVRVCRMSDAIVRGWRPEGWRPEG